MTRQGEGTVDALGRLWRELEHHPVAAVACLLLLSGIAIAVTCLLTGLPVPRVHDEFAYLLTGDTFASGRLTNPTHPLWRHFESFQIIQHPTYQGKYPPAQGLFLALGMILGHPIIGVWISVALMIVAVFWALLALLRVRWAFFGTLLMTLQLGTIGYWAQSYWGGAVAAGAGALLFGTGARIVTGDARTSHGVLGGIGLAFLANSRPLEGFVFTLVVSGWVVVSLVKSRGSSSPRPVAPAAVIALALAIGAAGVVAMGVYNHAVTGEATTLPYVVHEQTYPSVPVWLTLPPPEGQSHSVTPVINHFYEKWAFAHDRMMDELGPIFMVRRAFGLLAALGPGCVLLFFLPLAWFDRGVQSSLVMVLVLGAVTLLTDTVYVHYFAPAVAPAYLLIGSVSRRVWERGRRPLGQWLVIAITVISVLDMATPLRDRWERRADWATRRQQIVDELRQTPGKDLVFVHYPPSYEGIEEWVYNRADIDGAPVVWARSLDPASDAALVRYFHGRRIWDLTVGDSITCRERSPNGPPRIPTDP